MTQTELMTHCKEQAHLAATVTDEEMAAKGIDDPIMREAVREHLQHQAGRWMRAFAASMQFPGGVPIKLQAKLFEDGDDRQRLNAARLLLYRNDDALTPHVLTILREWYGLRQLSELDIYEALGLLPLSAAKMGDIPYPQHISDMSDYYWVETLRDALLA